MENLWIAALDAADRKRIEPHLKEREITRGQMLYDAGEAVGRLADRMPRGALLAAGIAVLVVADLVIALVDGLAGLALGVALWGLHMGMTQGLLAAQVADVAPAPLRGTAFGVFNLVGGLALLVASTLAGALWDVFGPRATFLAGAGLAGLALLGLLWRGGGRLR